MGARNRVRIGLSYRPAKLHMLAKLVPWNRFLGSIKVLKIGLCSHLTIYTHSSAKKFTKPLSSPRNKEGLNRRELKIQKGVFPVLKRQSVWIWSVWELYYCKDLDKVINRYMFQKLNFDLEVFKKSLMFKSLITKPKLPLNSWEECLYDNFSSIGWRNLIDGKIRQVVNQL